VLKTHAVSIKLDEEEHRKLEMLKEVTGRSGSNIFRRLLNSVEMTPDLRLPIDDHLQAGVE
jgi:predicted transcriptional regulator